MTPSPNATADITAQRTTTGWNHITQPSGRRVSGVIGTVGGVVAREASIDSEGRSPTDTASMSASISFVAGGGTASEANSDKGWVENSDRGSLCESEFRLALVTEPRPHDMQ
jgi:hypothetical protein